MCRVRGVRGAEHPRAAAGSRRRRKRGRRQKRVRARRRSVHGGHGALHHEGYARSAIVPRFPVRVGVLRGGDVGDGLRDRVGAAVGRGVVASGVHDASRALRVRLSGGATRRGGREEGRRGRFRLETAAAPRRDRVRSGDGLARGARRVSVLVGRRSRGSRGRRLRRGRAEGGDTRGRSADAGHAAVVGGDLVSRPLRGRRTRRGGEASGRRRPTGLLQLHVGPANPRRHLVRRVRSAVRVSLRVRVSADVRSAILQHAEAEGRSSSAVGGRAGARRDVLALVAGRHRAVRRGPRLRPARGRSDGAHGRGSAVFRGDPDVVSGRLRTVLGRVVHGRSRHPRLERELAGDRHLGRLLERDTGLAGRGRTSPVGRREMARGRVFATHRGALRARREGRGCDRGLAARHVGDGRPASGRLPSRGARPGRHGRGRSRRHVGRARAHHLDGGRSSRPRRHSARYSAAAHGRLSRQRDVGVVRDGARRDRTVAVHGELYVVRGARYGRVRGGRRRGERGDPRAALRLPSVASVVFATVPQDARQEATVHGRRRFRSSRCDDSSTGRGRLNMLRLVAFISFKD